MPVGVFINTTCILLGGLAGSALKSHLPERVKTEMTAVFGVCAVGIGVLSIVPIRNLSAVVLAMVIGTLVGLLLRLGDRINRAAGALQRMASKLTGDVRTEQGLAAHNAAFTTVIVLFCASATGIYGSIYAGMSGDHTILISKSILDLFTAAIFACSLGAGVAMIAVPQLVLFLLLFAAAKYIYPLTTPEMIADFQGCGGLIMLATGLRMANIRSFPVADMIPALLLVMPVSGLWTVYIAPLLG